LASGALFATLIVAPLIGLPPLALLAVLAPYPLALARLASGPGAAWLAALLTFGLIGALVSVEAAGLFLVAFAIPGLLLAEGLARGRGLLRGALWAFAWLTALVSGAVVVGGSRMAAGLTEPLGRLASREFLETLRSQGVALEVLNTLAENVTTLKEALAIVYPATFVVLGGLLVLANTWALRRFLARHDPGWLEIGEFEGLRWPFGLVIVFLAASAGMLVPSLRGWALNVLLLLGFLFALQGAAVMSFVGRRLLPPVAVWIVLVALAMTHTLAPLALLALLGLFDQWLDARRWAEPPVEDS